MQAHLPILCCLPSNKQRLGPLLFSDTAEERFGGKMKGNRVYILSIFFLCLYLHNCCEIIMSESSDLKNHMPFPLKWQLRHLYCCRVSDSNTCRSAEDNLSFDIFDILSMGASWSQSRPFGVVGREQRVSCALAPVTCWCANSCRGRRGKNYLLNLGVYEDAETSRLPNGSARLCHLAMGTGPFQGDPVQWALRGKDPFAICEL